MRSMPRWPPQAVLSITEPMMVGVASDLFAVIYIAKEHRIYVLNASGTAPSGATLAHLNELGYHADPKNWGPASGMPGGGILPVTVPGTVWGWQAALKRFGTLTFKEVLEAAAGYAEHGFPVSERIAGDWRLPNALPLKGCCTEPDPDSVRTWYVNGHAARARPDLPQPRPRAHLPPAAGSRRRRRSTGARSRAPSWRSPRRSAAP